MSGTKTSQGTSMVDETALTQAVADRNASAAPTNPLEQSLANLRVTVDNVLSRVAPLESAVETMIPTVASAHAKIDGLAAKVQPAIDASEALADTVGRVTAAVAPSTTPWFHAFQALEGLFNDLVSAIEGHFAGKIAVPAQTGGALAAALKPPEA